MVVFQFWYKSARIVFDLVPASSEAWLFLANFNIKFEITYRRYGIFTWMFRIHFVFFRFSFFVSIFRSQTYFPDKSLEYYYRFHDWIVSWYVKNIKLIDIRFILMAFCASKPFLNDNLLLCAIFSQLQTRTNQ